MYECELFFREVLVDNLLPAAVAASCSSQQWEKGPGRRVGRAGGPVGCSGRRQNAHARLRAGLEEGEKYCAEHSTHSGILWLGYCFLFI